MTDRQCSGKPSNFSRSVFISVLRKPAPSTISYNKCLQLITVSIFYPELHRSAVTLKWALKLCVALTTLKNFIKRKKKRVHRCKPLSYLILLKNGNILARRIYHCHFPKLFVRGSSERIIHTPAIRKITCVMFANGPGDLGSIPGRVIPKTLKMVLDTSLLNIQQYKVRNKGKVEQSRERSSPSPTPLCSSYWKESLLVAFD